MPISFKQWKKLVSRFITISFKISETCSKLLSNNRLDGDLGFDVDCRGHPIGEYSQSKDYQYIVLVGVWLAIKENI